MGNATAELWCFRRKSMSRQPEFAIAKTAKQCRGQHFGGVYLRYPISSASKKANPTFMLRLETRAINVLRHFAQTAELIFIRPRLVHRKQYIAFAWEPFAKKVSWNPKSRFGVAPPNHGCEILSLCLEIKNNSQSACELSGLKSPLNGLCIKQRDAP